MNRLHAMLMAGLLSGPAAAVDALAPEDFAYGFDVRPDVTGPLLELDLPDGVYDRVARSDLGDLRVFNGSGEPLPHALQGPSGTEAPEPVDLPFFALNAPAENNTERRVLQIVTDDRGAIIHSASASLNGEASGRIEAYLVDASALESPPERLLVDWTSAGDEGFTVSLDVLASDDLAHWRTAAGGAPLADLRSGPDVLLHNEIPLSGGQAKYLRIQWPEALGATRVTRVRAAFAPAEVPPANHTLAIEGLKETDGVSAWAFDGAGFRPQVQARLRFARPNAVVNGTLYSRASQDRAWQRRHGGLFYSLEHQGTLMESTPARFPPVTDPEWRFVVGEGQGFQDADRPTLELGWVPHRLTFVASGPPPYRVAFGSTEAMPAERPLAALLEDLEDRGGELTTPAQASEIYTLGGERKLEPPLPWRTWVLWAVLLGGVLMLAWMVRGLFRQLSNADGSKPGV